MIYPMDAIAGRAMIRTDALLNLPVVRAAVGDDDAAMRSFRAALQRSGAVVAGGDLVDIERAAATFDSWQRTRNDRRLG
jgi:hypothetical protein